MKKIILICNCFVLSIICFTLFFSNVIWAETRDNSYTITEDDNYYGTLYGSSYSEEDETKWITLKLGSRGFRLVNQEDQEIVVIDEYGGVYINGESINLTNNRVPYGFLYLLIVISLLLNVVNFFKRR